MEANSKTTGDQTEAKILYELISRGYSVSIPYGDNNKYDLIIDDDGRLIRVQCKTAWMTKKGTIRFNTHSQTTKDGRYHERTYHGSIDAFVVRYPPHDVIYWINIGDATAQKMELRFSAEIDHPSINWASEFELGACVPPG